MSSMDHTATPWHIEVERNSTVFIDSADSRVAFVFPGFEHANAAFIVTACNAYDQLVADNANLRQDLSDARNGWEQAIEDVREADEVLAKERALRERLVEALRDALSALIAISFHFGPANMGQADATSTIERIKAALAAAEAA